MKGSAWWVAAGIAVVAFLLVAFLAFAAALGNGIASGNTAHIKIRGIITPEGESYIGAGAASAFAIVEAIERAGQNRGIKAIIIDINSPGGSAVASEEIARAVSASEKPVVALIRDVGTSGAYWAASSSDVVVSSPLSITGSVGATASYVEFSGLMSSYGIGYERIVSGRFKDTGTPLRNLTPDEEELLQEMISLTADYFAQSVKENRNLDGEAMEKIGTGRIYTGQQALSLGLVDRLGSMETAQAAVEEVIGEESELVEYETREKLSLLSLISQQAAIVGRGIGASLFQQDTVISLR